MEWIDSISFKQVLDNSKQAFAMVGPDLKFVWCNACFLDLFEYTLDQMLLKSIFDVSDKENHMLTREMILGLINGTIKELEVVKKYIKKSGVSFYGKITVTIISPKNEVEYLFFVCISECKEHEKKCSLLQSLTELRESILDKTKDKTE